MRCGGDPSALERIAATTRRMAARAAIILSSEPPADGTRHGRSLLPRSPNKNETLALAGTGIRGMPAEEARQEILQL